MSEEKHFRSVKKELILLGCLLVLAVGGVGFLFKTRFSTSPALPERVNPPPTIPAPPQAPPELPKATLPEPTVEVKPESILVDNFDVGATSGIFKERVNSLGSYQGTWARRPSYTLISKSETVRRGNEGMGLVLDYYKDGGWCGYYTLLAGIDVSKHGLATAPEGIRDVLREGRAQDRLPYDDRSFDLVISLGALHNLRIMDLQPALAEIERVGKQKYVMVESYRNELEQFNLQCWALTAETFLDAEAWVWLYRHFGYTGDYEFIYFE